MGEYVARESIVKFVDTCEAMYGTRRVLDMGNLRHLARQLPAADVAPVVHARWNCVGGVCIDGEYVDILRCGNCSIPHDSKSRYCPHCGAKMDARED